MLNKNQLSLIHVAKNQLKLGDDEYRSILMSVCKVESAKEIKSLNDLRSLMTAFQELGFQPKQAFDAFAKKQRMTDSTISKEQTELIISMWKKITKHPERSEES